MKKADIDFFTFNLDEEQIIQLLLNIDSFDSLLFHTKYIERIIRTSDAYNIWRKRNFIYDDAYIDSKDKLDIRELNKTKIELHHYPYTLYDIVQYVGRKLLDNKDITDPYEVAKVVLEEHLKGNIGYVPLLITDHQKYHDGILEIDDSEIKGNYKNFERNYIE
jgi:hypothetical protein